MMGMLKLTSRGEERVHVIIRLRSNMRVGITESGGRDFLLGENVGYICFDSVILRGADVVVDPYLC
jgi:hypothetical protein